MNLHPEALELCQLAKTSLIELIDQQGPIPFKQYMDLALYSPKFGYYRNKKTKFGKKGDFITAPELSPLFSRCLSESCQDIAQTLTNYAILEIGAGSGALAFQLLQDLAERQYLPSEYGILEVSGALRAQQETTLRQLPEALYQRIIWHNTLPQNWQGLMLANEVMDAFPCHRVHLHEGKLGEWYVNSENNTLKWELGPPSDKALQAKLQAYLHYSAYDTEVNLSIRGWLAGLAHSLQKGVILLLDYGYPGDTYYHPDRHMGTLSCYLQHQAHDDPLRYPGIQDITAHVDFTEVIESAEAAELTLLGYTTQAHFLINNGLSEHYQVLVEKYPQHSNALAKQLKLLTFPAEMGEAIKVMALGKGFNSELRGFQAFDLSHQL